MYATTSEQFWYEGEQSTGAGAGWGTEGELSKREKMQPICTRMPVKRT